MTFDNEWLVRDLIARTKRAVESVARLAVDSQIRTGPTGTPGEVQRDESVDKVCKRLRKAWEQAAVAQGQARRTRHRDGEPPRREPHLKRRLGRGLGIGIERLCAASAGLRDITPFLQSPRF